METMRTRVRKSTGVKLVLVLLFLIFFLLGACGVTPTIDGVKTWTPSPSATATCLPNSSLSTPKGWSTSTRMVIILFKSESNGSQDLELSNGERAQDIPSFVNRIIPEIMGPGDQTSIFQLGYKKYENARVTRLFSYISRPQLYDTPSVNKILPTVLKPVGTPQPGLVGIATANGYKAQLTEVAATATANKVDYDCNIAFWNNNAQFTATAWEPIQTAEIATISGKAATEISNSEQGNGGKLSYPSYELYDGLLNAAIDLGDSTTGCKNYNRCILVIIDDLLPWVVNPPNNLQIDLSQVSDVYVIMPNCASINQPSCKLFQSYWTPELQKFGIVNAPVYLNGDRVETNLLNAIGR